MIKTALILPKYTNYVILKTIMWFLNFLLKIKFKTEEISIQKMISSPEHYPKAVRRAQNRNLNFTFSEIMGSE